MVFKLKFASTNRTKHAKEEYKALFAQFDVKETENGLLIDVNDMNDLLKIADLTDSQIIINKYGDEILIYDDYIE